MRKRISLIPLIWFFLFLPGVAPGIDRSDTKLASQPSALGALSLPTPTTSGSSASREGRRVA